MGNTVPQWFATVLEALGFWIQIQLRKLSVWAPMVTTDERTGPVELGFEPNIQKILNMLG